MRNLIYVAMLALSLRPALAQDVAAPIELKFKLDKPGFVTLVIDDEQGQRVRNLISETHYDAGEHRIAWDALAGADTRNLITDGAYLVGPGKYRLRGLIRDAIDLKYEFTVYNPGDPPWMHTDEQGRSVGGWIADHAPPSAVVFLPDGSPMGKGPQMIVGSSGAEWGHALVWMTTDGKKLHGQRWIGGTWGGVTHAAVDRGDKPVPDLYAYTSSTHTNSKERVSEFRLFGLTREGKDRRVAEVKLDAPGWIEAIAVHNGLMAISNPMQGKVHLVDAHKGQRLGDVSIQDTQGLAFDPQGRLVVIEGKSLVRYALPADVTQAWKDRTVLADDLVDPRKIAIDRQGSIYVSQRGTQHQVRVFDASGKTVRMVGEPGREQVGAYNPRQMCKPEGLAIDDQNRLWVAEASHAPKRISVWAPDGSLVRAYYGPPSYGGGGQLDPGDPTRVRYVTHGAGMAFKVDWQTGDSALASIYWRQTLDPIAMPGAGPQLPVHVNGRVYLTNVYNSRPATPAAVVGIWMLRDGKAVPVAALGIGESWKALGEPGVTEHVKRYSDTPRQKPRAPMFAWSDLNLNGKIEPEELSFKERYPDLAGLKAVLIALGTAFSFPDKDLWRSAAGSKILPPKPAASSRSLNRANPRRHSASSRTT